MNRFIGEFGQTPRLRSVFARAQRIGVRLLASFVLLLLPALLTDVARAEAVRAEVTAAIEKGHGRLIFTFGDDVKADVQVSNGILIVSFSRPVSVSTAGLHKRLEGYVQAVRRDPDGTAIRMSLSRRLTVNTMEAGERLFVDLLPEGWTGLPPGLPQSVVDDLAKRAREAERGVRAQPLVAESRPAVVRLQVSSAPTFSRFAFELPAPMQVGVERDGQEVRLSFDGLVRIDLGSARVQLPKGVVGLDVAFEEQRSTVKLVLAPNAEARDFREDRALMIDVTHGPMGASPTVLRDLAQDADRQRELDRAQTEKAESAATQAERETRKSAEAAAREDGIGDDAPPVPMDLPLDSRRFAEGSIVPVVGRESGHFSIDFVFTEPVSAAAFQREGNIWVLFDTSRPIDVASIVDDATRSVLEARYVRSSMGAAVRIKPTLARLPSFDRTGNTWRLTLADNVVSPSRPIPLRRIPNASGRDAIHAPLTSPAFVHHLQDPDVGDTVTVVTAHPPARGILREQSFVDFQALASLQGVALVPLADDLSITLTFEGVQIDRPDGLAVSALPSAPQQPRHAGERRPSALQTDLWLSEQDRDFASRESELVGAVSLAPAGQRTDARIVLARFYLARGFSAEAIGVLEAGLREDNQIAMRPQYFLLRGIAELNMGRAEDAIKYLKNVKLDGVPEAVLLRAVAEGDLGRWTASRDALRSGQRAIPDLPPELQRRVLFTAARASIEVRDLNEASRHIQDMELAKVPEEHQQQFMLLSGRLAESVGRFERAKSLYEAAAEKDPGPAAAEAQFRNVAMRFARGELSRAKAVERLETLSMLWRGDRIELDTIRLLARLYVEESRYHDAFKLLDAALIVDPAADTTHEFHGEMAAVFEDLFLTGKADALPSIDALALYYDFSRLTPIGRRGDELIRRLAERLVSVDLLDQAVELLDHQVNYRLTGAAKAQVAAKLAIVHLMNRKPADAVRVLGASRMPQLPQDLREQRMYIEARALSETGRHDAALELMENLRGPEADRLRADIHWAAKNWREAGERLEALVGERWKDEGGLEPGDRHDVLRAALAYTLGSEQIGLGRVKEKFSQKMGATTEGKVLELLVSSEGASPRTLSEAARALAAYDSLGTFIARHRERYPERPFEADPTPTSALLKVQRLPNGL